MGKARVCRYCGRYMAPGVRRCEACGGRARSMSWLWWLLGFMIVVGVATLYVLYKVNEKERVLADSSLTSLTPGFAERVNAYVELQPFSEGRAAVKDEAGRWGYIDRNGNLVIACRYENAALFTGGVAQVRNGRLIAYIDTLGNEVVGARRKSIVGGDTRFAVFSDGGEIPKYGLRDAGGNVVVAALYDSLTTVSEGLAVAMVYRNVIDGVDMAGMISSPLPVLTDDNLEEMIEYMGDSVLNILARKERTYGYVDLHGGSTFPAGALDAAVRSQSEYRRFVERQHRLAAIDGERRERLHARQQQLLADSIDAVLAAEFTQ